MSQQESSYDAHACRRPAAAAARHSRPFQAPRKLQPTNQDPTSAQPHKASGADSQDQPNRAAALGPDQPARDGAEGRQNLGTQDSQGPAVSEGLSQQTRPAAARYLGSKRGKLLGTSRRDPTPPLQV